MKRPRGYTLVEVLVCVTLGSAMFGLTVAILYALKEAQATSRACFESGRAIGRLAEAFREDVHGASTVERSAGAEADQPGQRWLLSFPSSKTVAYEVGSHSVERIESSGDSTLRETFRLPKGTVAEVESAEGGSLVALRVVPVGNGRTAPANRPMIVEAVVGLSHKGGRRVP